MSHNSSETAEPREPESAGSFGDCWGCRRRHALPLGNARAHALEMMREFEEIRRLDYRVTADQADPRLSFANLFARGRGNMFGVLECEDEAGNVIVLRAFSSLWDGIRQIDGWVSPILAASVYEKMILPAQQDIKAMTKQMSGLHAHSIAHAEVHERRKVVSQTLWEEMIEAYRFRNFRGDERRLADAIWPGTPIPGGIGECCAPKLLNHAARKGLRPLGLAEFYWDGGSGDVAHADVGDRPPRVASRVSGEFYPSCEARCRPILGFMLCGLDE